MSKTYWEKLKDPRWQKKRLEIMERDEFKCRHCDDATTTLNVHHRYYISRRDPWDYEDDVFMTLCEPCHEEMEAAGKLILRLASASLFNRQALVMLTEACSADHPHYHLAADFFQVFHTLMNEGKLNATALKARELLMEGLQQLP